MNELRLTDPFELESFEDMFRGLTRPWPMRVADNAPRIKLDLREADGRYVVRADVPGVRKEDIDVRIDGNQVTISAEVKKDEEEKKDGRVIRSERQYGFANRTFTLACDVDESKAAAHYKDGVLELTLPKKNTTSAKRLQIA